MVRLNNGANARIVYNEVSDIAEYINGQLYAESAILDPPDGRLHLYCTGEEYSLHTSGDVRAYGNEQFSQSSSALWRSERI